MEEGNLMKNGVKVLEREYLVYPHKVLLSLSDYGIYTLGGQGATGKTYLRKQLEEKVCLHLFLVNLLIYRGYCQ